MPNEEIKIETEIDKTTEEQVKQFRIVPEDEPSAYGINNIVIPAISETSDEVKRSLEDTEEAKKDIELNEDLAIEYLAKQKGLTVDEFKSSLEKKPEIEIDEDTKSWLKYKKETGNSYSDFLELQKDWSTVDKDTVLLMALKAENPTLTDKEINYLFEKNYSYDADLDDDDEITEKEINIKRDYQKGLEAVEKQKEQYKTFRGSEEGIPEDYRNAKKSQDDMLQKQKEYEEVYERNVADFKLKTEDVFSTSFEGFEVKVGNESFKVKPEDVQGAKNTLSDLNNFNQMFFDEQGQLKDAKGYYKALHFAMNADKMAEHFINIGKSINAEEDERESKNIKIHTASHMQTPLSPTGKPWKIVKD